MSTMLPIATAGGYIRATEEERLVVLYNWVPRARGNVLLVPPFGRSARDMFIFAYYLRSAGFNVLRFDARNHVGMSSGDIASFTLSSLHRDVGLVYGRLREVGAAPPILVGISLSAPVAMKFAAENPDVLGLVSIVGTTDVPYALEQATGARVQPYRAKEPACPQRQTILGYEVIAPPFIVDMDAHGFGEFYQVLDYVRRAPGPLHMIMATEDAWVPRESAVLCHEAAPPGSVLTWYDGATHEFGRSALAAKRIGLELCTLCGMIAGDSENPDQQPPNFAEILRANATETQDIHRLAARPLDPRVFGAEAVQ